MARNEAYHSALASLYNDAKSELLVRDLVANASVRQLQRTTESAFVNRDCWDS
jgi:hypothetical protein